MSINDIEDVLFDGSESAIANLREMVGTDDVLSYSIGEDSITIRFGNLVTKSSGLHYKPNCVKVFGNEHSY